MKPRSFYIRGSYSVDGYSIATVLLTTVVYERLKRYPIRDSGYVVTRQYQQ